jgi:hypothetical protein
VCDGAQKSYLYLIQDISIVGKRSLGVMGSAEPSMPGIAAFHSVRYNNLGTLKAPRRAITSGLRKSTLSESAVLGGARGGG